MSSKQVITKDYIWRVFSELTFSQVQYKKYIQIFCKDHRGDEKVVSSEIKRFSFSLNEQQSCVFVGIERGGFVTVSASRAILTSGRRTMYTIEKIICSRTPL